MSKADKLTRQEQAKAIAETRGFLKNWTVPVSVQLFSSLKKTGVEEADQLIGGWLGLGDLEAAKKEPPGKGMPGG